MACSPVRLRFEPTGSVARLERFWALSQVRFPLRVTGSDGPASQGKPHRQASFLDGCLALPRAGEWSQ